MGLFSRKKSEQATRSTSRTATSSEAQAAELRGRARRRLIGALVLVLTAIIVVPMLFDDTTSHQDETPMVLPAIVPPLPEPDFAVVTPPDTVMDESVLPDTVVTDSEASGDAGLVESQQPGEPAADQSSQQVAVAPVQSEPQDAAPVTESRPEPKPEPRPEPEVKPTAPAQSASKPADDRTDDGSVALALLEGRTPPSSAGSSTASAQSQQGNFVLQVAAYSTEADAQSRRTSLVNSGVTNAYVEQAVSNNRTTYRLRVGSFPTRDAAQAAQARLRALGYDNSMLLTQ